ncbi:MAG TPA: DNA/RNA nuclease SfsA [Lachnospiraceae bacterium]|nr:DNA/RNA nuclease SfsA [Lachnospiraceae bacterium]
MEYKDVIKGEFLSRPNRFIAHVIINNQEEIVHVKNTGRCKELLIKGATVYLELSDNPNRKTKYDLIMVEKWCSDSNQIRFINMDSQAPNKAVGEWLKQGIYIKDPLIIKPETKFGNSRFDFYIETKNRKIFLEVKGVTLEDKGIVKFPDAPSLRAVKHLEELIQCMKQGFEAYVFFLIQMKDVNFFEPNDITHKLFGDTLRKAKDAGVHVIAYDSVVWEKGIMVGVPVPIVF